MKEDVRKYFKTRKHFMECFESKAEYPEFLVEKVRARRYRMDYIFILNKTNYTYRINLVYNSLVSKIETERVNLYKHIITTPVKISQEQCYPTREIVLYKNIGCFLVDYPVFMGVF